MAVCNSCGRQTDKYVVLQCPAQGCSGKITRCSTCKENENPYACPVCGFSGP